MPKSTVIKTHMVQHMWVAYADTLLKSNENYIGINYNKITNFYIYDNLIKKAPRKVKVTYKPTVYPTRVKKRVWNSTVHGSTGLVYSYTDFRKTIETFFRLARTEIIQGRALHLKEIGKICAFRKERDFRKKNQRKVNWGKTRLQPLVWDEEKQKEIQKLIFHNDDDWCRIGWFKPDSAGTKNITFYEFKPAAQNGTTRTTGFKQEFSTALTKDKLLKFQYLYIPIKDRLYT